ncbi:MAG: ApaG domain, partial [Betaproteobacteria bacterium]|nr:ApaG domain [Betaproteobacteria bacterium]
RVYRLNALTSARRIDGLDLAYQSVEGLQGVVGHAPAVQPGEQHQYRTGQCRQQPQAVLTDFDA